MKLSQEDKGSRQIEERLIKIAKELEYRKKVDPLKFHKSLLMQRRFELDPAKRKCIFGGNRSGKTEPVAKYVIKKALSKKNQKIWVAGETFSDSVSIQQKKIWNLCPKNEIKYGYWAEINGFPNRKLLLKNGSLITFKSYDQTRTAFQSDDIDLIWNDEEPPYDIYCEQKMRLIDRDGEMIISMTSLKGVTDFIDEVFDDCDIIESEHAELVDEELPRVTEKGGIKFYFLWTTENPHISQERLREEIELMPKDEIKSRVYGVPINLSGRIYPLFNKDVHTIDAEDIPKNGCTLWNVLDPHDSRTWAISWWAVHIAGTAYCISEYPSDKEIDRTDHKTYDEYVKLIKGREDELKKVFKCGISKRIIDPNFGAKSIQLAERQGGQSRTTPIEELKKRGLKYDDGIDSIEDGHLKVRQMLSYEVKNDEIIKQPKILFSKDCKNHISHMSKYSWKDILQNDGDIRAKPTLVQKYKDFPDLTRYFCMANPKYVRKQNLLIAQGRMY